MSTVRVLIARGWCRQPIPHSRCIGRHYSSLQFQATWALNVCPPYVGSDRIHLTVWVSRSLVSLTHCPLSMPAFCCPPCLPRPTGCLPVWFFLHATPAMLHTAVRSTLGLKRPHGSTTEWKWKWKWEWKWDGGIETEWDGMERHT